LIDRDNIEQSHSDPIDVADWESYGEFDIYPEGAREKNLIICPEGQPDFLISGHRYLFKLPMAQVENPALLRHPEQYWSEIIAFRLGRIMGLQVPPAFVSFNSTTGMPGALIEWFTGYEGQPNIRTTAGGDHMARHIPDFDRDTGAKHNLATVMRFSKLLNRSPSWSLIDDYVDYWGNCLCFDALIGNTDRHQENWKVLWDDDSKEVRFSPYFDNGTSLGQELCAVKVARMLKDKNMMEAHIRRGKHHMRLTEEDDVRMKLIPGVVEFVKQYPPVRASLLGKLSFSIDALSEELEKLTKFNVPYPLLPDRAELILKLTQERKEQLIRLI